jgi:uncharacterized membrane protein (UPF0127 family)
MTIFRKALIAPAFLLLFFLPSHAQNRTCVLSITAVDGRKISVRAEIADTPASRADGLMFRRILGEDEGMIFVFEKPQMLSFWMRNTYIPLSIAYISGKGIINEIHDMKPLDDSVLYPSARPAMYALEVKQGWFKRHNITGGCRIDINGCIGK